MAFQQKTTEEREKRRIKRDGRKKEGTTKRVPKTKKGNGTGKRTKTCLIFERIVVFNQTLEVT